MPGSRHLENGNGGWLPAPEFILQVLNFVVSLAVVTGLFAMMFKMLPDARIAWTDVWVGAVITAFLFTVGQFLIGLFTRQDRRRLGIRRRRIVGHPLGLVYYSAQIFLFGAEFT